MNACLTFGAGSWHHQRSTYLLENDMINPLKAVTNILKDTANCVHAFNDVKKLVCPKIDIK